MAKYKIVGVPKKAEYFELDLTPEEIQEYAKGGFIIEDISVPSLNHMQDGGIVEYNGFQYKKDKSGNWINASSGAPVTDQLLAQKLTYEGKPVGSPVVQGAPKPVMNKVIWENASGDSQKNAIAREKQLQALKNSPKVVDQELAKQIEQEKVNAQAARDAQINYNMTHEKPLDMMDYAWGAAAALPVALPAIGEVAATNILGTPLTYGNVGSLAFATHGALNADNVVQDWKDVYAGKKDWRDAALNTGLTGLEFLGVGSGVKNLASALNGERLAVSAMPGFNTAKAFVERKKLGDELANFKFNSGSITDNALTGTVPKRLPMSKFSSKISRDIDPGGKSLIKFGDEAHPGGEYYHVDPEDYNILNEQTGKLETDPNWKQEGLANANESLNDYLSKLPSYSSEPTKGLGSYDFAEFTPGWEAIQEAKGLFMGPQKTVGKQDFYSDSEFHKLLEDQMKYDMAYADAEYEAMLRNEKLDEQLFNELHPNLSLPDFRKKFLTPEQEKYVYNLLTQNPSVQSNPIGKQNLQKILEDNEKVQNALPSAAIKQELSDGSAEDVIRYFGNEIGLKESDIPKLSPEQLESAKNKIINKLGQFYNNYAVNGNLKKPFSGNDALKGMIYSVDGPGDKMMDARMSEAMRHTFLPESKSKNGQELLKDFYNRIQSPEGVRRLEALGINDPRAFRDLVIKELDNELAYYMEGPFIGEYIGLHKDMPERVAKKITRHELEHVVQKAYRVSLNKYGLNKLSDDYLTDIDKELTKLTLKGTPSPKEEVRFEPLNWDPVDFPEIKDLFTNHQRNLDYFTYGSKGKEKAAFLAEVQQSMLEDGLIKDVYDKITVKDVEKAYKKYMEDTSPDKYKLRYFEIIDPTDKKNFKITADQLNKMLTVTGIGLGVGLSSQGEEQGYAFGGSIRRSKLNKFIG